MLHDLPVKVAGTAPAVAPAFDPSLYPRTYRIPPGRRAFFIALGGFLFLVGLLGMGYFAIDAEHGGGRSAFLACLYLPEVLLGPILVAHVRRYAVTLSPGAVEIVSLWSTRRLRRAEIRGLRLRRTNNYPTLVLVPSGPGRKKLNLYYTIARDAAFEAWFAGIPDLDAEDRRLAEAAVAVDPRLGSATASSPRDICN